MGTDVIDFTILHKRGLLKSAAERPEVELLDLSATRSTGAPTTPFPTPAPASENSAFDFLSSFAQASATTHGTNEHLPGAEHAHGTSDLTGKLDTFINKLEDTMYKIELLSSRIAQLEGRFSR